MASATALALALLTAAAGHPDGSEGAGRRLSTSPVMGHIWQSSGSTQCSAHLSAGPADADVEVVLAGLPPSTAVEEVHLQWWAPRKSATPYDPLVSAVNCAVHSSLLTAYPRYSEASFNGGNVRVSESGQAVIRVRAPSTYFMWKYIAIPHVHLRLCTGASSMQSISEAVVLGGPEVWVSSGRQGSAIRALSARPFAGRDPSASPQDGTLPIAIITGVEVAQPGTTAMPAGTTTEPFTTTKPATTTPAPAPGLRGLQISAARDALDLDALEFSPVYTCLLEQKFFSHFTDGCAQSCPAGSDVAHGQCVRRETADPPAQLDVSWQLGISCGSPCWHSKKNVTLHGVRLSFAGHLDVPFQEVEVEMGFAASASRRLSTLTTAYLTVRVASNRVAGAEGRALLGSYPQDAASMTSLLGLDVRSVTAGSPPPQQADPTRMDGSNDPYEPAYTAIENGPTGGSSGALSFLPMEAIIGIAAGLLVLGAAVGAALWYRRRQRAAQAQAPRAKTVEDKVAQVEAESAPTADKQNCI